MNVAEVVAVIRQITEANGFQTGTRPDTGFAAHPVFAPDQGFREDAEAQHAATASLVYGAFPSLKNCLDIVHDHRKLL